MLNNTRLEKVMSNEISFEVYDSCFPNPMRTTAENKPEFPTIGIVSIAVSYMQEICSFLASEQKIYYQLNNDLVQSIS